MFVNACSPCVIMEKFRSIFIALCVINSAQSYNDYASDSNVDPVSMQLLDYKRKHPVPAKLTTSSGQHVYTMDTCTLNTNLLDNPHFFGSLRHAAQERRSEREVFPKATGAHGYFEVTNDVSKYTKAKVFRGIGKRTAVITRIGVSQIDKGGPDSYPVSGKGFAVKFYTEDGNLDLLGINVPVYFYRDPIMFREFLHAFRPNPQTRIRDNMAAFDYIIHNPQSFHTLLWEFSEFGLPRGFRYMNAFPCHTYQLYNEQGQKHFAKFKIISELGYKSLTLDESAIIGSYDPDFFVRDFYNSIERKDFPSYRLEMDILSTSDLSEVNFDPFDVTRLWPNGTYTTVTIGRIVLNRNVKNYFAEIEQAAYNPTNLVDGIYNPPDQLFKGRAIAYHQAQTNRVGVNVNKIAVNCPLYSRTYNRDGPPPNLDNEGDSPNYYPNSFNGLEPYRNDDDRPKQISIKETNVVDLAACKRFYREITATDEQKQRLVDSMARISLRIEHTILEKYVELLESVDEDLAERYVLTLNKLKRTVKLPSVVEEVVRNLKNPFLVSESEQKCL